MGSQNQFEAFFNRADLDHDGRISGAEAVSFFQGSGLSKQVLAQIWMHADQNRAGFLGRQEFYNALKLVTVAQSKRDLTPELVKAALHGPASAKIPPPQINLPPSPTSQPPSMPSSQPIQMGTIGPTAQGLGYRGPIPPNQNMNLSPSLTPQSPPTHMGAMGPAGSLNLGYRGSLPPNQNMNQHYYPSQANQMVRPSQGPIQNVHGLPNSGPPSQGPIQSVPGLSNSGLPSQGPPARPGLGGPNPGLSSAGMSNPGLSNPNNSSMGWLGGMTSGAPSGPMSQLPNRGPSPSTTLDALMSSHPASREPKGAPLSGNGFSSNSNGGGDPFAAFQMIKSGSSPEISSMSNNDNLNSSAIVPVSSSLASVSSVPTSSAIVPIPSAGTQPLSASRSLDSLQSAVGKQPLVGQPQVQGYSQPPSQIPSSVAPSLSGQPQAGARTASPDPSQPPWPKMTTPGIQKYTKVFMEVDSDRDGKITGEQARNLFLSWRLPREVLKQVWDLADQDSDSMLSLREFCIALYLMERFREGRPLPPSLPDSIKFDETLLRMAGVPHTSHGNAGWGTTPSAGFRPVQGMPGSQPMAPAGLKPATQSPPESDMMHFHQSKSRTSVSENSQATANGDGGQNLLQASHPEANEVEKKVEKVYLDSREKLEYYRSKMQELVLYKSRCDNRLNEIIERASADKREAELLGKKYEEKYKLVAEIASKMTIEEARFREYQARKTELQQAITNMEQGGSADGILQVRADRIQSDFEELLKALSERCKKHGIEIKSAALIELPKGWQPGIQEGALVWDEEWDKFEDEGLLFDKDVAVGTQNTKTSPKSTLFENGTFPHDDLFDPDSPSNADTKSEKQSSRGDTHSEEDSARSPHGSPAHRTSLESPSQDFSDVFARSSEADTDFHRSFDAQDWGNFDGNDDVDSVWGFEPKDQQVERIFDSSGFGSSPRNDSPQGDNSYNNRSPFNFADSVPGTPSFSKSSNSPRYSEAGDGFFDNYSRFDSFNMNESSRFSPPRETLTRFDSISSSQGGFGGHSRGFTSFDDADPFGSTGPFKVSSETPKKTSDNWSSF